MNDVDANNFLQHYYRDPQPFRAPELLRHALTSGALGIPGARTIYRYFLLRLAQDHPGLVAEYELVLHKASEEGRAFVRDLLATIRAHPTGTVLDRPIETPADNDMHWVEFCLTGSLEPVRRLVDVLERPDLVRTRLETWLVSRAPWPRRLWSERRLARVIAELRRSLGIVCDPHRRVILTADDLDGLCMLQGMQPMESRLRQAMALLPFRLSDDDVRRIWTKGTATWSLCSFAKQHPAVLELCTAEVARRRGRARLALQAIVDPRYTVGTPARAGAPDTGVTETTGGGAERGMDAFRRGDHDVALREWRRGAEAGDVSCQSNLAMLYATGTGVTQDYVEAIKWYRRAADQGQIEAEYALGNCYAHGWGVRPDDVQAVRHWRRAAERGHPAAQYNLGEQYAQGRGVPVDLAEACRWFDRAAAGYQREFYAGLDMRALRADAIRKRRLARLLLFAQHFRIWRR